MAAAHAPARSGQLFRPSRPSQVRTLKEATRRTACGPGRPPSRASPSVVPAHVGKWLRQNVVSSSLLRRT